MKADLRGLLRRLALALLAVLSGCAAGALLLLLLGNAGGGEAIKTWLLSGVLSRQGLGESLSFFAPLLLSGLSALLAAHAGILNAGASGQFTVGAFFSLLGALQFRLPWWLCLALGAAGGALWGMLQGLFCLRSRGIMAGLLLNGAALWLVQFAIANTPALLSGPWYGSVVNRTASLAQRSPTALIPAMGLDAFLGDGGNALSVLLALGMLALVWGLLKRTVAGYEIRVLGAGGRRSGYAGIEYKKTTLLAMALAGGLAGLGGGLYYLRPGAAFVLDGSMEMMGYWGIGAALIGQCHPLGTAAAAGVLSVLRVGSDEMQSASAGAVAHFAMAWMALSSLLFQRIGARRPTMDKAGNGGKEQAE